MLRPVNFFFGICYLSFRKRVEFIQVLPSLAVVISTTNRLNLPTLLPALLLLEQTHGTKGEFGNTCLHKLMSSSCRKHELTDGLIKQDGRKNQFNPS